MISTPVRTYIENALSSFDIIPAQRKEKLTAIAGYIADKLKRCERAELIYICTHNSRRSHFGQIWGSVSAAYYRLPNIYTYSGGTETTAFNSNAIKALERIGFIVNMLNSGPNPRYRLGFGENEPEIICFSKVYDNNTNPQIGFCAIMTCSDAEENCPFIPGAEKRVATPYEDPKKADNSPEQDNIYDERCLQIARETLYVFSLVKDLV